MAACRFKPEDAFVGYHKDIPATILFQAQKVFRSEIALSCPNKQDEPSEEEKRKVKANIINLPKV